MARRSLCSQAHAVSYELTRASSRPWAETPSFCELTNQTAVNQVDNGVCERWKIVPAAAEVFSPHSAHIHNPRPVFTPHDFRRLVATELVNNGAR